MGGGRGRAPADLREHPQVLPRQDGSVPDVEVEIPADESKGGGETAILGGATSTAAAAEDEESNVSTDSGRVRGRRPIRAESTTARTVRPNETGTSCWRAWLLQTWAHGTFYGACR